MHQFKGILIVVIMLWGSSCASTRHAGISGSEGLFSFALIGDMPYAPGDVPRFEQLTKEINAEVNVDWVLHVGDIKTGGSSCSDAFLESRLALLQQFNKPLVIIPGDNEWTDCHRPTAGKFQPLERLGKLRTLLYPVPGQSLGGKTLLMDTQAADPAFAEFPEHVRWIRNGVVLSTLHIVGSMNGMAPFPGRTAADDQEATRRMDAAVEWMEDTFAVARESDSPGVFLMMHASIGFTQATKQPVFASFLETLEREAIRFGKPVMLAHGDSHYFRIDKPLVHSSTGRRIENFTRVEAFGAGDVHWLRVTVDPEDENVFEVKQEIVRENLIPHAIPN
ncbi:MAG: metallophosphoesterase [Rhodothermales bacterium]